MRHILKSKFFIILATLFVAFLYSNVLADYPKPWQLGMQEPASPVQEAIHHFHNFLLYITFGIAIFVLCLLVYVIFRFNEKSNPNPSKTTHNTILEVVWTVIPICIIIGITVPSVKLLIQSDEKSIEPEMTLKVIGRQWYWTYEYPDNGGFTFDSNMLKGEELKPGQFKLLDVDNRVVLPVNTLIRIQMTASDVIHAWFVPSLGIQKNAIPGKLTESWVKISKPGVYYGQCNYLCGINHAFMPIAVEAVTKEKFKKWAEEKQKS